MMYVKYVLWILMFKRSICQPCTVTIEVAPPKGYENNEEIAIACLSIPVQGCQSKTTWIKSFSSGPEDVYRYDSGTFNPIPQGEYTLQDRAYGIATIDTFVTLIINATLLEDSGNWQCRNGNSPVSIDRELTIMTRITRENVTIHRDNPTIIGLMQTYTCTSPRVYPLFDVEWQIDGRTPQSGDDSGNSENDDGTWSIHNTLDETLMSADESKVLCRFKYEDEEIISKESEANETKYAVFLEYLLPTANNTIHVDELFQMTCVASGTNPEISWKFNNEPLDKGFIRTGETIDGNFKYGQTKAKQSNQTWTMSEQEKTCENMYSYNGKYRCEAKVEIGDITTEESSGLVFISVTHIPLLKPPDTTDIVADIGVNVTLKCEIDCSTPPVNRIQWNSVNGREGLDEFENRNEAHLIIVEEDYEDTIHCKVSNAIGEAGIAYTFVRVPTTTTVQPTTTTHQITTTTLQSTVRPGGGDDKRKRDLIIANVVIYTLVAIFSVITALLYRHYRKLKARHDGDGQESDKAHENFEFDNAGAIYEEMPQQQPSTEVPNKQRSDREMIPSSALPSSTPNIRKRGGIGQTNVTSKEHTVIPKHNPGQNKTQHLTTALAIDTQGIITESSNKLAKENPKQRGPKPPISRKPSDRASRMSSSVDPDYSDVQLQSGKYDNKVPGQPECQLYANCGVSESPKQDDDKVKYAELTIQEDPYSEGAPDVPVKLFNDNETVQYASIKHNK